MVIAWMWKEFPSATLFEILFCIDLENVISSITGLRVNLQCLSYIVLLP